MITAFLSRSRRFVRDSSGSLTIFFALLLPVLLLIGGLATDAVRLNAQKRYVQSQADLAAQSAARVLPDVTRARAVARAVVAKNDRYGTQSLTNAQIEFGAMSQDGRFIPAVNQNAPSPASALRVTVPSPYQPFLLGPVLRDDQITIRRRATAGQDGVIIFLLRNRLLSLNTRDAILGPLLNGLGLGVNLSLLGYRGLVNTQVRVDRLLGIVSTGLNLDLLTFNDVLQLPITLPRLFQSLADIGGVPQSALRPNPPAGAARKLGEVLTLSPSLLGVRLPDILPDLTINAADLLSTFLGLSASPNQRVAINTGLDLSPLANVTLSVGLIRPPVIAIARSGDSPQPAALLSQTDVLISANVLQLPSSAPSATNPALLSLNGNIALGTAEARLGSLNCAATADRDILATFDVRTAPVELALRLGILDSRAETAPSDLKRSSLSASHKTITVTYEDYRKKTPVAVPNPLSLSGLIQGLGQSLTDMRNDILNQISENACNAGLLSPLLCPIITVINTVLAAILNALSALTNVLASFIAALGIDLIVQAVLNLLGIGLAQADLIVDDYSCSSRLYQ